MKATQRFGTTSRLHVLSEPTLSLLSPPSRVVVVVELAVVEPAAVAELAAALVVASSSN